MKESYIIVGVIVGTGLLIGGGIWLSSGMDPVQQVVETDGEARLVVNNKVHDWGNIPINGGNAEAAFEIKNEGSEKLQLFNVVTSCMCTTAQLFVGDERSSVFGMHTKSRHVTEVEPGGKAQLKVIFDPAFHGPQGTGAMTRQIRMQTNDANQPALQFDLSGVVIS